jgi:hypothetical protein
VNPLLIDAIRDAALVRRATTTEDIASLLELCGGLRARVTGFAWAAIAHRVLMALLPSFDNLTTYNERCRALNRVLTERGLQEQISPAEFEGLIELGDRIHQFRAGARKTSWSDLHYITRREILVRQNHRCVVCGVKLQLGEIGREESPELDHIVPFAMRGNVESNTRVICKRCNLAKLDHLTYVTQGHLAVNDQVRSTPARMNRLLYWAIELASSRCETVGCVHTSLDGQLFIVKRTSLIEWNLDNALVVCSACCGERTRYPTANGTAP